MDTKSSIKIARFLVDLRIISRDGHATCEEISRHTGLHRSTVYRNIKNMYDGGIVTHRNGGVAMFRFKEGDKDDDV